MCKQNPDNQESDKAEIKHIDTVEESSDYTQSEYITPFYVINVTIQMCYPFAGNLCTPVLGFGT